MNKEQIKKEAIQAAQAGYTPNEACHYPFSSNEGRYWITCYIEAKKNADA